MKISRRHHARLFLCSLWALMILSLFAFGILHLLTTKPVLEGPFLHSRFNRQDFPPGIKAFLGALRRDPNDAVQLDEAGRLIALSDTDLKWLVGRDAAVSIETSLTEHTKRINDLHDRIIDHALLEFRVKLGGGIGATPGLSNLLAKLDDSTGTNDFQASATQFTRLITGWGEATRNKVGERAIFELNYGLQQMAQLKREQFDLIRNNLAPPRMHQIFWTSPVGALTEAVFWSFIGTLVNLIVNVSQARSRGTYRADDIWISFSKLIYGPVLSFILILAMYFGLINAGTEVRFWLLPLLGFFFGYSTRKVAMMVDALSEKLLGTVAESIEKDAWKGHAADMSAKNVAANARPKNFEQLLRMSPLVSDSTITAAVIKEKNQS